MNTPLRPLAALLCLTLTAGAAHADPPLTPDVAAAQLSNALALISGGAIGTPGQPVEVTRDGDAFSLRVPLPSFTEPPAAALTARAQPMDHGVWNLTSAALPSAGVFALAGRPGPAAGRIAYMVGQQNISARIDPSLNQPSPFQVELRDLTLQTSSGDQSSEQTIAHEAVQGVLTGDADHRLTLRSQTSASGWRIAARDHTGTVHNSTIHSAAGSVEMEGVDRGQADRLRVALQAFAAGLPPPAAAPKMADLTPERRSQIAAILDGLAGLLDRFTIEQTIEGITFAGPDAMAGAIGLMRVGLSGESQNDNLVGSIDLTLHDLKVAAVPPEFAAYVPTLLQMRPAVSGIRTTGLLRLLHHVAAGATPDALSAEAMALLNQPGVRLGIDNLSMNSGPLRLEGAGRMLPPSGGMPGLEAHIVAHGLDAMLISMQGNPQAMKIVPLIFLAKGMARPQDDGLVWDIAFADGAVTVNGTPLGQPHGPSPGQTQVQPHRSRP